MHRRSLRAKAARQGIFFLLPDLDSVPGKFPEIFLSVDYFLKMEIKRGFMQILAVIIHGWIFFS
jgi:hypothetical protein